MVSPKPAPHHEQQEADRSASVDRRRFLTYLVAAPTLTVATHLGLSTASPSTAEAVIPSQPNPPDIVDLGDIITLACAPTSHMLVLEVGKDGRVRMYLPRAEVGQGLTTSVAMLVAEEMDLPLSQVEIPLSDARPELLFNQITGGSASIRALYDPVRRTAAAAKARMINAAGRQWNVPTDRLVARNGSIVAPDGRTASYGALAAPAADPALPSVPGTPKPESEHKLVGTPTSRKDARDIVMGKTRYTLDIDVPGAMPTMVRRPPSINGTVKSVQNEAAVRAMPGVLGVTVIPTGVAVMAETFGQALDAKNALEVTWNKGTVDEENNETIKQKLRAAALPFVTQAAGDHIDAEFDFAPVSHAPMESNSAVADVREDRAEIWGGFKTPIVAQQSIAQELGLPQDKVKLHVLQAGGSFGRRLFWDAAREAALASQAFRRPVRLMWTRTDDMRHGRTRPASLNKIRVTYGQGQVTSYEQRVAAVETDTKHGLGEIFSATATHIPIGGNLSVAQSIFVNTVHVPYNFGPVTEVLNEIPLQMHTGSFRSVYSPPARGSEEIIVDELAQKMGKDPVDFRREFLKNDRQRAVLDKVASAGEWGKKMPKGFAQGIGFHEEYKSVTACLVEVDARDPKWPRVTKAVIAADVGRPINPRGLESQLLGGLTDAISTCFRAGLHIDRGLPLEGSYSQFHYARQKDSPRDVQIFILPANGEPGGAGELGVAAAFGAVANAYARATGTQPRSFPINFDVDFEPFPR